MVEEGTISPPPKKKGTTADGPSFVEQSPSDFSQSWQSVTTVRIHPHAKVITVQAPRYRQHALISDFQDLANLRVQEEVALATNWIDDRPEELRLQNLALATMAGPVKLFLEDRTAVTLHSICYVKKPNSTTIHL